MIALSDALAPDDTLQALARKPMRAENAEAIALVRRKVDPNAKRKTGTDLLARGFRYLGTRAETAGYFMRSLDVFVDRDATTYVTVRRMRSILGLSSYYILTYFDDGTCIETVARKQPLYGSHSALQVRGGHVDDIGRDVEEHFEAVRERVEKGARILPVRDMDAVVALGTFYITHIAEPLVATAIAETRSNQRKTAMIFAALVLSFLGMRWWRH